MKSVLLSLVVVLAVAGCQRAPSDSSQSRTDRAAKPLQPNLQLQAERQKQQIKAAGIVVTDSAVQTDIDATITSEFGGDSSAFQRELLAQGYTLTQFREYRRSVLAVRELHDRTGANAPNK